MVTLKQLFQAFSHDPKWQRFAASSTQSMMAVFMRQLGHADITTLTRTDIEKQLTGSDQTEERKVKARSCMHYMLQWAKEHGKAVPQITHHATNSGNTQKKRRLSDIAITHEEWQADTRHRTGTIEHETTSKGWKNGKRVFKDCWRAVIAVNGQRYRHRARTRQECREWLDAVLQKRILPTDNKADWLRMEQHKDEEARIDEHIVSAAEEANIVYEYRQTGDTQILYDYCIKSLLPHMVYYCAHTLRLGKDRSLTCSRQAVGLILTKIVGGRPITNITFSCKRMLRTYQNRGDFWYYEKAPRDVQMIVDGIDYSQLAEVWKVTKDRRI